MKAFHFGLEKVLRLREQAEEEARLELGRAVSALASLEHEAALREQAKSRAASRRFAPGAAMLVEDAYIERLDAELARLKAEAEAARQAVEAAREAWRTAQAEKAALEKLRDRERAAWRAERFAAEESEAADSWRPREG